MLPKNRPPTPPGVMLLEEFLRPRGITQTDLARRMEVPVQRVNTIVNGKRGVSAETAVILSEVLGTTPEFWMGLQADHDLWHAMQRRVAAKARGPGARRRAVRAASRSVEAAPRPDAAYLRTVSALAKKQPKAGPGPWGRARTPVATRAPKRS